MGEWRGARADEIYEQNVFHAKVYASIKATESVSDFVHFQIFRMRLFEGVTGKDVALRLGISEPQVSRHVKRVRNSLRVELQTFIETYSFTDEERTEGDCAGLAGDAALFDEALCEIWHRQMNLVLEDEHRASKH